MNKMLNSLNKKRMVVALIALVSISVLVMIGMKNRTDTPSGPRGAAIVINEEGFLPSSLTVLKGTTISIINDSEKDVTIVFESQSGGELPFGLDRAEISPGQLFSFIPDEKRSINYFEVSNSNNPNFRGVIVVVEQK